MVVRSVPKRMKTPLKKNKPRILVIDNSVALTGAYKSISTITFALSHEFEFTFCLPSKSSLLYESRLLRNTIELPFSELRRHWDALLYLPRLLVNGFKLLSYIKKNRIEVLHVNDLYNMLGVLVKSLWPNVKVVYHIRLLPTSYVSFLYRVWLSLIVRQSDGIVCVSKVVQQHVQPSAKTVVVYDAVDILINERKKVLSAEGVQALYLANYTPGKGHEYAIRAFARAFKRNDKLRLTMVGGDFGLAKNIQYKKSVINLAETEGVFNWIEFLDFAHDTQYLYEKADIFLNFSHSESFSLTCLEAMSNGVPVVCSDSGGPREIIEPGLTGIIVPVGDIDAMSEALYKLSIDENLRRMMATRGKMRAEEIFGLEKAVKRLNSVYLEVLKGYKAAESVQA